MCFLVEYLFSRSGGWIKNHSFPPHQEEINSQLRISEIWFPLDFLSFYLARVISAPYFSIAKLSVGRSRRQFFSLLLNLASTVRKVEPVNLCPDLAC